MVVSRLVGATPWKIAGQVHDLSRHGMIMGVLNVTPDSFSDGGEYPDRDAAVKHGVRMAREGAAIIDIGGESTRPGAESVFAAEEIARVIPVIRALSAACSAFLSIDTMKADVARAAVENGASIINDVSGGTGDPEMFPVARETGAALVIMHMKGTPRTMQAAPQYHDVLAEVADFFRQQYACALECGIDSMSIAFDPGIGFGKTLEHNLTLLRSLPQLRIDDRPLVAGVSRKSFLGKLIGSSEMADRRAPTIAMTAALRARGANVLRVHEVPENVAAMRVAESLQETNL
ncbi:MAG TPA: dihydropteroate synthase [Chthoniobacterales bacterium]|nr:dihydropteroate synthase [Chthoniobacterales bacterium]